LAHLFVPVSRFYRRTSENSVQPKFNFTEFAFHALR
jgi:hypothetical protein